MNISSYVESLKEAFNAGDPELRKWFLIGNNYLPLILSSLYVMSVKVIGPYLMKQRSPFTLRNMMIFYNLFLVATYCYCIGNGLYLLIFHYKKSLCSAMEVSREDSTYEMAGYVWGVYVLKYVEFLDTIFLILKKKNKQITNLHVIHHSVLPVIIWTILRTETGGFHVYPGLINSITHVIMYSYYGLAAMGPKVQKYLWWKRYLTILQMTQFVIIVGLMIIVKPLMGCETTESSLKISIAENTLFFVLFYNFYRKTFKKEPSKINAD